MTTWDQWTKAPGRTRESLVSASFASGSGHTDTDTGGRVVRTFLEPGRRVLLFVDSLDEAADLVEQPNRLQELRTLRGWRAVVTSRPAAWEATYRGDASRDDDLTVLELLGLDDPEAFIAAWFVDDPAGGRRVVEELRGTRRADLARVPLMVTFYCLLAEDPNVDGKLPTLRGDLYRRLVQRLLRGGWAANAPGPDAGQDDAACTELLTTWAWQAVRDRVTSVGLGDWGESFRQPSPPRRADRRAVDHVAPKVAVDVDGHLVRRFVHRTLMEHFVAEHVATLKTEDAVEALLPHLWFDPDWEFAAPAAIAAHNRRRRGALLPRILDRARARPADAARQRANWEIELLLLRVAEESDPDDWPRRQRELLHETRIRTAVASPPSVARSAHWAESNGAVRAALLDELIASLGSDGQMADVAELGAALASLGPSENDLTTMRNLVVAAFRGVDHRAVGHLVEALAVLMPTEDDRAAAAGAILSALLTAFQEAGHEPASYLVRAVRDVGPPPATMSVCRRRLLDVLGSAWDRDPRSVEPLIAVVTDWSMTEADRHHTRQALLAEVPAAWRRKYPWPVRHVIAALAALSVTDQDRVALRRALTAAIPVALHSDELWVIDDLLSSLAATEPRLGERDELRRRLLAELPRAIHGARPGSAASLVAPLPLLASTTQQRAAVRHTLVRLLPETLDSANPGIAGILAQTVAALDPTASESAETIGVLLRTLHVDMRPGAAIPSAGLAADYLPLIVETLAALGPAAAQRAQARHDVTALLSGVDPQLVDAMVRHLCRLVATPTARHELSADLLRTLSDLDPWATPRLVQNILTLDSTVAPRARLALLGALTRVYPGDAKHVLGAFLELQPTYEEIATARGVLLASLAPADRYGVLGVAETLPALQPSPTEEGIARDALIRALQDEDPSFNDYLVAALPALNPSASDRAAARAASFNALLHADESDVEDLVVQLLNLAPTDAERAEVRGRVIKVLRTNPDVIGEFLTQLPALVTTKADRAQVRAAFRQAITQADEPALEKLVIGLRLVSTTSTWLTWLRKADSSRRRPR